MAGWTTSYRWNGVTSDNVAGLVNHHARDVDRANGVEVNHSNDRVNPALTHLNETLVNDGTSRMIFCTTSKQWIAFMKKRLTELQNTRTLKDGSIVNVAHRKDANVAVDVVMQLDPAFTGPTENMTPEKRAEIDRLMDVMIEQASKHAGPENVIGYSKHWDESSPHVQMLYVPGTEDGKLSMKQKLGGKDGQKSAQAHYSQMHDDMRRSLQAAGYEATMVRVDAGRPHRKLKDFKDFKDREASVEDREEDLQVRERDAAQREKDLGRREEFVASREVTISRRTKHLSETEAQLAHRETGVSHREDIVRRQEERAAHKLAEAAAVRRTYEEREEESRAFSEELKVAARQVNQMISDLNAKGAKFTQAEADKAKDAKQAFQKAMKRTRGRHWQDGPGHDGSQASM